MIVCSQHASLRGVLNKHRRPGSSFSDRLMLSHSYSVACFPIKPVKLPLLLLPGPELTGPISCKWFFERARACACVFVYLQYIHFCMGRYLEGSEDSPHQSLTEKEMESRTGVEERWGSPQEAASEKSRERQRRADEWMDQACSD